jgi:hypothetical protein
MNIPTTIPFNDKVLKLIRKMPESSIGTNGMDIQFWENKLDCDMVLKKDGILFFCSIIADAYITHEYVTDLKIYDSVLRKNEMGRFILK